MDEDQLPQTTLVVDYYLAGASLQETGRHFRKSPSWVRLTLVFAGIRIRPAGRQRGIRTPRYNRRARARDAEVIAYYLAGFSLRQTGARFGLTWQGVAVILAREGIARRPRGWRPRHG